MTTATFNQRKTYRVKVEKYIYSELSFSFCYCKYEIQFKGVKRIIDMTIYNWKNALSRSFFMIRILTLDFLKSIIINYNKNLDEKHDIE